MASKDQFTKFDDWAQLSDCKDYLDTMDKEVKDIFMLIQQKTREADDHIRNLQEETQIQYAEADSLRNMIEQEMIETELKVQEANQLEKECLEKFSKVLPELQEATTALQTLENKDFIEMKSFVNPPILIKKTLEGCFLILGRYYDKEDKYWQEAKKEFSDPIKFVEKLQKFDKDNIPDKVHNNLVKFFSKTEFDPAKIARASKAAKGLCRWVRAMHNYHLVNIQARPLREALKKAKEISEVMQVKLESDQEALAQCMQKCEDLKKRLEEVEIEKEMLKFQLQEYEERLALAIEIQNMMKGSQRNM